MSTSPFLSPSNVRMSTMSPGHDGNVLGVFTSDVQKPMKNLTWHTRKDACPFCDVPLQQPDPQPNSVRRAGVITGPEVNDMVPVLSTPIPASHLVVICRSCHIAFTVPKDPNSSEFPQFD